MNTDEEVVTLMQLISEMRKYMSVGGFAQRTPRKIILEFKDLMKKANAVHIQYLKTLEGDDSDV